MSSKISGRVWDLDLPHAEQFVLLAMADHADHEGRNVRPSVGLVAWKTNYSPRQVHRIIQSLREKRILLPDGAGRNGTLNYRIDLSPAPLKTPYTSRDSMRRRNDKMSHPELDKMSHPERADDGQNVTGGVTPRSHTPCDIAMSYDPSLTPSNPQEEEESLIPTPVTASSTASGESVNEAVAQNIHVETIAALRAEGIVTMDSFNDIPANVIRAAAVDTGLPLGHVSRPAWIVKRLRLWREGKWTPSRSTPTPVPSTSVTATPQTGNSGIWAQVLDQLRATVPPSDFLTWLEPTVLLALDDAGAVVGAANVFAQDVLRDRFTDPIAAALEQTLGRAVAVQIEIGANP